MFLIHCWRANVFFSPLLKYRTPLLVGKLFLLLLGEPFFSVGDFSFFSPLQCGTPLLVGIFSCCWRVSFFSVGRTFLDLSWLANSLLESKPVFSLLLDGNFSLLEGDTFFSSEERTFCFPSTVGEPFVVLEGELFFLLCWNF